MSSSSEIIKINTKCCIVGGGPAGMTLGYLLARAGIDVVVLEKHGDFLRDFRGDTVHPSTLELMHELGILDDFLKLPHQEVSQLAAQIGNEQLILADFSYLASTCKFIAFMPQWSFLDFLSGQAKKYSSFSIKMNTEATGLIEESDRVIGVIAKTQNEELHIKADLVVAADGRTSLMRQCAKLEVQDIGAPMDVLWMRLSRKSSDPPQTLGRINFGIFFIMLNRGEYWQCALVIPKGRVEQYRSAGLEEFRQRIRQIAPFTEDRINELQSWDDIKLLTVKIDRLATWYRDGLLCIGDSAHAMSPVGGVGINLAIQDAVAAANILWQPLHQGSCTLSDLKKIQDRRTYPTHMTQHLQVVIQNNAIKPVLESTQPASVPWFMHSFQMIPYLRSIPARLIGIGFRPEHIRSPDIAKEARL